jgi:hypothetical protein
LEEERAGKTKEDMFRRFGGGFEKEFGELKSRQNEWATVVRKALALHDLCCQCRKCKIGLFDDVHCFIC